jgi:hypothetical protein
MMHAPFPYKNPPLPKQREALQRSVSKPYFALTMVQGTGKSYVITQTAAFLYLENKIDGLLILAPNGVHSAWVLDQLPEHMPLPVPWRGIVWRSGKMKAYEAARQKGMMDFRLDVWDLSRDYAAGLAVLAVNSEALTTPLAKKAIDLFLKERRCLLVVDESGDFTTPGAKRTRALQQLRRRAPYRRILDGTPVGVSPFELYSPYKFLSPSIIGCDTFEAFKDRYAEWEEYERSDNGRKFKVIKVVNGEKQYRNLDELAAKIAPYTFRCTKAEALPDLPPKIFEKRIFEMSEEQWRMTTELQEELTTAFADGATVTATIVLTQYLRLQQIACGYVPPDQVYGEETEPVRLLDGPNPRLDLGVAEAKRHRHAPQIIWTRFGMDIDLLQERLAQDQFNVWVYDGRTSAEKREAAHHWFREQAGPNDVFLGNARAGGRGLNLFRAEHVMYYANYFGLRTRLQSEDRAHRIGTKNAVLYTDLLGLDCFIDWKIVRALRQNQNIADIITGDPAKDWL